MTTLARLALVPLLVFGALRLDGLFDSPATSDGALPSTSAVQSDPPSAAPPLADPTYPIELPLEACAGTPLDPGEVIVACTDYGPDPDGWTPGPGGPEPGWQECHAYDDAGLVTLTWWEAECPAPEPTP